MAAPAASAARASRAADLKISVAEHETEGRRSPRVARTVRTLKSRRFWLTVGYLGLLLLMAQGQH